MQTFRSRTFMVSAEGSGNRAVQVAGWLLEHSARVMVRDTALRERIIARLRKRAPDGKTYATLVARLVASAPGAEAADERALFSAAYRGPLIVAGNMAVARWAHHLAERSAWCGGDESPLVHLERLTSRAIVVHDDPVRYERSARHVHVLGSARGYRVVHARGTWETEDAVTADGSWLVAHTEPAPVRIIPASAIARYADRMQAIGAAVLAARAIGTPYQRIGRLLADLPALEHDRQILSESARLRIIDDGASDTAQQGAASVRALGGPTSVLIAGGEGTGDWSEWADAVRSAIRPTNLILLDGTATVLMRRALGDWGKGIRSYDSLRRASVEAAKRTAKYVAATLIYSPASTFDGGVFPEFARALLKKS